ncbi:MAG TPA: exodeoxyribonuclease V subunit alpha [Kofleriaceae bacterium]|nr:exodeoxyribonuclease V subunit alpha [Kofleriaceae bacterium]
MSTTPPSLHPRGSLRAKFAHVGDHDGIFRKLGVGARRCDLGDEGLYLAEEIVAADRWLGGSDPEALGILVLALMIAQRQGSSRLPLDDSRARSPSGAMPAESPAPTKARLRTLVTEIMRVAGLELDTNRILKRIKDLTSAPSFNSVIGTGDARLPLIVDDGCLYTERSRYLELRVAKRLAARLAAPRSLPKADMIADLVARPGKGTLSAEQLRAVELALSGSLAVVTGGPGTGKTLVAAAIVRGFARLGVPPIQIALAAQTGKAANRLTEMIGMQLAAVASPADADRALVTSPPAAQTLHRLLGYRGDGFAHHAQSPLPVGALIVDEASMVDLELMDALLDALPASVPLILIGDAHQLPAIDAGQILADLAEPDGVGAGCVATLEHSFRMDAADPRGRAVLEAARAVRAGEAQRLTEKNGLAALRTPGTLKWSGAEWVDTTASAAGASKSKSIEPVHAVAAALWHHFDGPLAQRLASETVFRFSDGRVDPAQQHELDDLWTRLGRARLLTVTRGMPTGSLALNAFVHQLALERMTVTGRPEFVPGEPVMITANDYQRGLYNGDQGMIIRADEGSGAHRYRAVFRVQGQLVPFAIEALRDRLELAWALTVHKSQGSELDALALVLPEDEHLPLLTRELLYTGITRARTSAVLCGSRAAIVAAGKRGALRHSGLATRLRALR